MPGNRFEVTFLCDSGGGACATCAKSNTSDKGSRHGNTFTKCFSRRRTVLCQSLTTVKEQPWFVKAMGNPVVLGALTIAAAKMLNNKTRR